MDADACTKTKPNWYIYTPFQLSKSFPNQALIKATYIEVDYAKKLSD